MAKKKPSKPTTKSTNHPKHNEKDETQEQNTDPKSRGGDDPKLFEEVGVEEVTSKRSFGARYGAPFDDGLPFDDLASGDGFELDADDRIRLDATSGTVLHRDLGQIEVTASGADGLAGITINRTKRGISPFVPIIKTPNFAENSGNLTGYSVEIEDPDSKTGYKHLGNVSKNYLLLTNEEVRELAIEIAMQSGLPFKESRIFWDGSRFCHIIDFLETEEIEPGDEVGLSLITRSSYDKTWRYEAALMGKRFVCDNGAISGEFFARVSFKHLDSGHATGLRNKRENERGEDIEPKEESWQSVVRQGLSVIDHAPENLHRFVQGLRILKRAEMTDERLREVWRLFPSLGDSIKGQILSRYVDHEEPTLFGLFNAGTNVFWHREKMTSADYQNNDTFTSTLLQYAIKY